jgi:outer membrane lipoprotein-sorting protein
MKTLMMILGSLILALSANALTVKEIVRKMEAAERAPHAVSRMKQTVVTAGGSQREFEILGYAADSMKKQLQVYERPARVRGEKILLLDDGNDIWAYSPRTTRVRHIATHMKKAKVMGSDFSYEDMAAGDYLEKFTITLKGNEKALGEDCYKLLLKPTPKGPGYKKMVGWVAKSDFIVRKIDYYDKAGLLKTLTVPEVRTVDGRPTLWKMKMKNVRDGGETRIEVIEMDYKTVPDPGLFTEQGLRKR